MQYQAKPRNLRRLILALAVVLSAYGQNAADKTGGIHGVIFTLESNQERSFVPGVRVHIQCIANGAPAIDAATDETGRFAAGGLPPCGYRVTVEASGLAAAPQDVAVQPDQVAEVEIELKAAALKEEVTVSAQAETIDPTEESSKAALHQSTLENAPNVNERVEGLLPLLPGVVRGPDGLINMKGARTSQNGLLLNSANVTDPVTGLSGINLPVDVVSTATVVANPYDPEFGKFTGAVETVETRVSDFNKYHVKMQNFMPRMRKREGDYVGIESATPRLTFTGPLIRGRAAITQSLEYRYVRTPVDTLPQLKRDTGLESLDSFTQVDLNLTERQSASATVAFFPQKLNYLGLNTFNPQEATPNLHQRGYFLAFSHKLATHSGSLLASQISYKTFDADVKANSTAPYRMEIETTTGGFFNRQDRDTSRIEWQEVFTARPLTRWGQHQLKLGGDFVRHAYDSRQEFQPVQVLRASGMPAERIGFSDGVTSSLREREYSAFLLDTWKLHPKITVDLGLRTDRDSIADEDHAAPRVGVAISPFAGGRTVIRAGVGFFYDRINLNIPTFASMPQRLVTQYHTDGTLSGLTFYTPTLTAGFDNPRSTAWNAEIQHQASRSLILRAGYSQRNTVREFFIEPTGQGASGLLLLSNEGRTRYREFQTTAKYQIRRHVLNASYVRSNAYGDLNDFNQFYGNTPNPVIRPNERSRLNFDAPNRFVFWGQFQAPWKITLAPVLDVHTGFPYSVVDEERDYVGARNRAGRFPTFASADLQVTKEFAVPFRGKKRKVQAGVRMFNILNHYNPRDFQSNLASDRSGVFLNSVDRMIRGKLVVEF